MQIKLPAGIAVDSSGNVYVADSGNNRVQKFTSNGTLLYKWGSRGSNDGQFTFPTGIAVDSSGNVYVADGSNSRVQKFTSNCTFLTKLGSRSSGNGELLWVEGVAVDSSGNLYVADTLNDRVQKFTSNCTFLTTLGGSVCAIKRPPQESHCKDPDGAGPLSIGDGQFWNPNGVAVDSSGNLYVADTLNDRVQKFTSNGTFLTKWG